MKPHDALRPWITERPPPMVPTRPWVRDLEEFPPVPDDLSERVAELRKRLDAAK